MDKEKFSDYLKEMREIVALKESEPEAQNEIIAIIQKQHAQAQKKGPYDHFFKAEMLFHKGHYEQALKYYLAAKGIPFFQFFCYRASSAVAKSRGQDEQAIKFAEKAAKIEPLDPIIRNILQPQQPDAAQEPQRVIEITTEPSMNTYSDIFSSSTSATQELPENNLTERLYDFPESEQAQANEHTQTAEASNIPETFNEACSIDQELPLQIQTSLAICETEKNSLDLELAIETFQKMETSLINSYLARLENRKTLPNKYLCSLDGWNFDNTRSGKKNSITPQLLTEESRKSRGGHYVRWNNKGIVINPGAGFIENFHQQGFCIRDIDYVIVTWDSEDAHGDVKTIYELNNQLNKTSAELQIIHYYLNQKTFQELSVILKPSFKQARNTIHNLEIFLDSPDVEKVELTDAITLHYFLTSPQGSSFRSSTGSEHHSLSSLGIRLELGDQSHSNALNIGYISGMGWSPLIAHHLGRCDILLAAFGNTNIKDYSKLAYAENCLGYYGCSSLMNEVSPKLMLLTEFGGREGDIRLEVIKKIRSEKTNVSNRTIALPSDIGMIVDLEEVAIKCSLSENFVSPEDVHVVASSASFGKLNYLSPRLCI